LHRQNHQKSTQCFERGENLLQNGMLQGDSQKLLLTTKESIVSNIFSRPLCTLVYLR